MMDFTVITRTGAVRELRRGASSEPQGELERQALKELEEYFAGERREFDVPTDADGTNFEFAVWCTVEDIPYGETRSYAEVAREMGAPKAVRAVARAIAKNPIPIIIPCHRVIRSDGSIGGYAWGVDMKRELLKLEGVNV